MQPSADPDLMVTLVTGGAGFIGSAVVRRLVSVPHATVVNVDALTYAGNLDSLADVSQSPNYHFEHVDVTDAAALERIFRTYQPDSVLHLAAESHVDRSIDGPSAFIDTNLVGTFRMLEASRRHWEGLAPPERDRFRYLQVSTDEVYGSLGSEGYFTERSPYAPNSPYSASKAGADHLARAWHRTYGMPVLITNCSNNYGPYQFPEKLIPLMISNLLARKPLPVYGEGTNVRGYNGIGSMWRTMWRPFSPSWSRARLGRPMRSVGTRSGVTSTLYTPFVTSSTNWRRILSVTHVDLSSS